VHAIDAVHTNLKSSACLHEFLKAINPIGAKITITPYDPHYLVRNVINAVPVFVNENI
jgi:hypothetical protein